MMAYQTFRNESGTALVIALSLLTILLGLTMTLNLAVNRSTIAVRFAENQVILHSISKAAASYTCAEITAGHWQLENGKYFDASIVNSLHGFNVLPIKISAIPNSDDWVLDIRTESTFGTQTIKHGMFVRISMKEGRCRIVSLTEA
ncbi:hypothetical protein K8T06_13595 [bacterium]|nr:hypothetical protein [bacterium]